MSTAQTKTKNLAWVVFTCSIGLILGPAVGGFTSEKNLVSWFGYETPFLLAALVSILNAIFLFFSYKEPTPEKPHQRIQLTKGFTLFISAFADKKFALLSIFNFCFILAWSLYYQTINWFFMINYHYSVAKLGLFVAYIGVIFAISTTLIARFILKLFSNEARAFTFFIFTMAIANMGAAYSQSELAQWLWVILNATSNVICYTVALTLFSNLASHESQGWIMGVTGAIGAITWTVGGLISGPLGYVSIQLPFWVAGGLCLTSFGLILVYQRIHTNVSC